MKGRIFNIQRFSIHDGPGIRTCVFLQGCPLNCVWCHNPEGQTGKPVLSFLREKCLMCGCCVDACKHGVHFLEDNQHHIDRSRCIDCTACVGVCPTGALEHLGREASVDEIVETVKRDILFYGSAGGVTLTGGEPLAQPEFSLALAKKLKSENINVCIETSGAGRKESIGLLMQFVDYFLFDIKHTDAALHRKYTGAELLPILSNLRYLDSNGAKIILRCPIIPDINDNITHYKGIADIAAMLHNVIRIDLEAYHPMGVDKRKRMGIGIRYSYSDFMDKSRLQTARELIEKVAHIETIIS